MNDHVDPFDELATMFLSDGNAMNETRNPDEHDVDSANGEASDASSMQESTDSRNRESAGESLADPSTIVESLLVGHLPVRAGLWLTPYADAIARQIGPTVLIRLDRETPSIQLLRGKDGTWVAPPGATVESTIADLGPHVAGWIVYAGDPDNYNELLRPRPGRITILSSADDVAVVKAYQLIKDLVASAENSQLELPQLGLAVLGADAQRSRRVLDRINPTTSSFLGIDLDLVAMLPQMDADIRSSCFLTFANTPTPRVADVLGWIDQAKAARAEALAQTERRPEVVDVSAAPDFETDLLDDVIDDADNTAVSADEFDALIATEPAPELTLDELAPQDDPPVETPDAPMEEPVSAATDARDRFMRDNPYSAAPFDDPLSPMTSHGAVTTRTIKLPPAPVVEVEPKTGPAVREPDRKGEPVPFASHIKGLSAIAPRCPDHETVELAIDPSGRVHLLARADDLRHLRVVEQWIVKHRELLSMACPQLDARLAGRGGFDQHIFTDTPRAVADLHATNLNLYVLAPVDVGNERGWYVAPLK